MHHAARRQTTSAHAGTPFDHVWRTPGSSRMFTLAGPSTSSSARTPRTAPAGCRSSPRPPSCGPWQSDPPDDHQPELLGHRDVVRALLAGGGRSARPPRRPGRPRRAGEARRRSGAGGRGRSWPGGPAPRARRPRGSARSPRRPCTRAAPGSPAAAAPRRSSPCVRTPCSTIASTSAAPLAYRTRYLRQVLRRERRPGPLQRRQHLLDVGRHQSSGPGPARPSASDARGRCRSPACGRSGRSSRPSARRRSGSRCRARRPPARRLGQPADHVMVGDGDGGQPLRRRLLDHPPRLPAPVGPGRVQVQIDVTAGSAERSPGRCTTSGAPAERPLTPWYSVRAALATLHLECRRARRGSSGAAEGRRT